MVQAVKKNPTKKTQTPIRRVRLKWGEHKIKFCSLITLYTHDLVKSKAEEWRISKSDLIEHICRRLDDPEFEQSIFREINP